MMHRPWEHAEAIKGFFKDHRLTKSGLAEKIEKSLQQASELESLALSKKIPIVEPFEGVTLGNGVIRVFGPSLDYYREMLACFEQLPEVKSGVGILAPVQKVVKEAVRWVEDKIGLDLLSDEDDTTSAQNNTSTIILFTIDGHKMLFTGDAGKTALLKAISYGERIGTSLSDLRFLDVPHHGSKRNLNTRILQKITAQTACISAPKESAKHPSKKVTNALLKRGMKVYVTRGSNLLYHNQGNARGWGNATLEPFHAWVEE
jgi:predicted RNA binding protein YcfA (HicA-like mRNA interferase family)